MPYWADGISRDLHGVVVVVMWVSKPCLSLHRVPKQYCSYLTCGSLNVHPPLPIVKASSQRVLHIMALSIFPATADLILTTPEKVLPAMLPSTNMQKTSQTQHVSPPLPKPSSNHDKDAL
jgi:hypothetical protein